ncbi:SAV0927 family protein [Alicyclobacillus sp. SO9]|uniref:SAV0927 family protein n=1 Tax=Alicyclobacillus sp. SO9 TaxID=2665646 RepID=UPI0018E8AB7E|nr:SAV0927 family protein [Alicyclobacillus sp. SO9]QQE80681.1 DUF3055 family protein [Alicyclobacillus sp. SO9]
MDDWSILYDNTEQTQTRYVGYLGNTTRFDVAITRTENFYGKSLVTIIQNGRTAIVGQDDAEDLEFIASAFSIAEEEEAAEFSDFLSHNL